MILNLFVAVIVENVTRASTTADVKFLQDLQKQKSGMLCSLHDLFKAADTDESGSLTIDEFNQAIDNGNAMETMKALDVKRNQIDWLFEVLDVDGDHELSVDEFMEGMLQVKASEISRNMFQLQYAVLKELKKLRGSMLARDPTAVTSAVSKKKLDKRSVTYNSRGQSVQFAPPGAAPAVANGESGPEAVPDGNATEKALTTLDEAQQWCNSVQTTLETLRSDVRQVQSNSVQTTLE